MMQRERTFQWGDPLISAKAAMNLPGLEYLQAMSDGKLPLPPLLQTLDFKVNIIGKGDIIFSFTPQEFHYNTIGVVHGGVISAILDSVMGCTLHSLLDAGVGYTTLELKVNFLKAVTIQSGELQAIGKVIHKGRKTSLLEANLINNNGVIFAHGTSTCLILNV